MTIKRRNYFVKVKQSRRPWRGQKWYVVVTARNGRVLASSELYHNREDANRCAELLRQGAVVEADQEAVAGD